MSLKRQGILFAITLVIAIPTAAQTVRVLEFNEPKRDLIDDYRAGQAEYAALMRRVADSEFYSSWISLTGAAELMRIFDHKNWAELDQPNVVKRHPEQAAEIAAVDERGRRTNQKFRSVTLHLVPDASLPAPAENQRMLLVRWVRVSSGHLAEYEAILKNELIPAIKRAGIRSYSAWQVDFGAPLPELVLMEGIDNWAFFDKPDPLIGAMGQDAFERYSSKTRALTVEAHEEIYRFRPELSYLPPKK